VTQDDLLYRFRLRTLAMAAELGNVRAACRAMGIHLSTYYRWKRQLDRYGPEILRPRERRVPRMANATSPLVEQRVVAFAQVTRRNPSAHWTSALTRTVATDLAARGWELERVMSDTEPVSLGETGHAGNC
jgi:transposase